jgi:MHS family proline/betaine transporter-like MFS transporter
LQCLQTLGFFSDIIAQLFFAPSDDTNGVNENLVRSFAVYGGAFMMRPVGGILIGYLGDKHGRKYALVTSLFLMSIPTFAMGCLPTYSQIGSWSTALLVICRMFQGMSVGGQLPASLIYTLVSFITEITHNLGSYHASFLTAVLVNIILSGNST